MITSVWFGFFLFDTLSEPNPSALSVPLWAVLLIGSLAVMVLRAVARHQMFASSVNVSNPDT